MRYALQRWLESFWYDQAGSPPWYLLPLESLYNSIAAKNKRRGLAGQQSFPVPLIVVGNISIGGTGKTPLVVYLIEYLQAKGYRPGVITRGYGGTAEDLPRLVSASDDPMLYGDEPVLLAMRSGVPVVAGPDRNADVSLLLGQDVNVIISDDGMQHYRLWRDVEICLIDAERGLGNRHCLPAGPLRESPERLEDCDIVVYHEPTAMHEVSMQLQSGMVYPLSDLGEPALPEGNAIELSHWSGQTVHAVSGIGNPARFFGALRAQGIELIEHAFPDHHPFTAEDIQFADALPVFMTEKDAVKCRQFANKRHRVVPVSAVLSESFDRQLSGLLTRWKPQTS